MGRPNSTRRLTLKPDCQVTLACTRTNVHCTVTSNDEPEQTEVPGAKVSHLVHSNGTQYKVPSYPVSFTWTGQRFEKYVDDTRVNWELEERK
jgi:hypothetical protein